jgi:hypothetical protein
MIVFFMIFPLCFIFRKVPVHKARNPDRCSL